MLLTFDTASPAVTAAVVDPDRDEMVLAELVSEQTMRHGEQLAPLIEAVLREAGAVRQDVTAVGVGVGPGPFTGLRVGLVTARTLGYVLDVPVYGVCSLDVLAAEAVATGTVGADGEPFVVATDARRKEVYVATYDADGTRLEGPSVEKPAVVAAALASTRPSVAVVGEGALLYPAVFPGAVGPTRPSAGWLGRALAAESVELFDPDPLYLRRPDAEVPGTPKRVS